jgi:hypothetical protein
MAPKSTFENKWKELAATNKQEAEKLRTKGSARS